MIKINVSKDCGSVKLLNAKNELHLRYPDDGPGKAIIDDNMAAFGEILERFTLNEKFTLVDDDCMAWINFERQKDLMRENVNYAILDPGTYETSLIDGCLHIRKVKS